MSYSEKNGIGLVRFALEDDERDRAVNVWLQVADADIYQTQTQGLPSADAERGQATRSTLQRKGNISARR